MKSEFLAGLLLMSVFFGCSRNNEVIITGHSEGKIPDKIVYSVPVNGASYFGFTDTVRTDSSGNFRIKILTREPGFININIPGTEPGVILACPGQTFHVSFNTGSPGSFKVTGPNQAGQEFCNTLPKPILVQLEARKYFRLSSQDSVKLELGRLKQDEVVFMNELLKTKQISKEFYHLLSCDRDCFYASLMTQVQYLHFIVNTSGKDPAIHQPFPSEMKKMWEETYIQFPPSEKDLIRSRWWQEYAEIFLMSKEYLAEDFKISDLIELNKNEIMNAHKIELAEKYFTDEQAEYFTAVLMHFQCSAFQGFEKEFIGLYDKFKSDFPGSAYIKYLDPYILPIIAFHKLTESGFPGGISLLENYQSLTSLRECVKSFEGKKIFVDVWATWCAPCKEEFEKRKEFDEFLRSKGFEILYISIDQNDREQTWKDMIKYYKLKGYHVRAGSNLIEDLKKIQGGKGGFFVPWHLLVDESGNIIRDPGLLSELEKGGV